MIGSSGLSIEEKNLNGASGMSHGSGQEDEEEDEQKRSFHG
jgi:hypothetical protein